MPDFSITLDWDWIAPADFLNKTCNDRLTCYKVGKNIMMKMKLFPINGTCWD